LNDILDVRDYLVGVALTAADIAVACTLQQLFTTTIGGVDRFPALQQWLSRCLREPEFVAVLGPPSALVPSQCKKPVGGADGPTSGDIASMSYPIKVSCLSIVLPDLAFNYPIKLKPPTKGNRLGSAFSYPIK
jgi:hypothetical protein